MMTMTDAPPPGWVLTIEGAEYVAYRPIGWDGPDPHVRVSAPTRDALIHKLTERGTFMADSCAGCSTALGGSPTTVNGARYCSAACAEADQRALLAKLQEGRETHRKNKAAGKYRR